MRRDVSTLLLVIAVAVAIAVAAPASAARVHSRNYLAFSAGADLLTAPTGGTVIDGGAEALGELGIGHQLADDWLLEFTYGISGRWQADRYVSLDPFAPPPADDERVWRVTTNTLFLRSHWVPGGARTEYFKPALSAAAGFVQVTRLLRNYPSVPPFDTSQLLVSGELGAAGLFVFSNTFMGSFGARYRITERRPIANDTHHLDGLTILLAFRVFLPSPRDVEEPEPPRKKPKEPKPEAQPPAP